MTAVYSEILEKVKKITNEAGVCAAGSLLQIIDRDKVDMHDLINRLREDGIGYVRHAYITGATEVLVDLRMIAAIMLITSSRPHYIAGCSVREHISSVLKRINSEATDSLVSRHGLMSDLLDAHLGSFSIDAEARKCKFTNEETELFYQRSLASLNTLVKNDEDLTAVYKLALLAFSLKNDTFYAGNITSLKGLHRVDLEPNSTFNHFHRLACVLVNRN